MNGCAVHMQWRDSVWYSVCGSRNAACTDCRRGPAPFAAKQQKNDAIQKKAKIPAFALLKTCDSKYVDGTVSISK